MIFKSTTYDMRFGRLTAIVLAASLFGVSFVGSGCASSNSEKKKDDIKDAEWHYKMGVGYFENQKIHPAIRSLNKALEMDPEMADAHFVLGFIYSGRKKYHKAIEHYKEAIRLEPKMYKAKNNLGSVYLAMERWRDAAELFKGLIEESMYPTPELAHNNLGWSYYNLREYKKALEHFETATFLKPEMCLAHNNLGLTHRELGNMTKAKESFRTSIRKCPDNYAEPHFNLGKLLREQGSSQATRHFDRCAQLVPDSNLADRCRQYLRVR